MVLILSGAGSGGGGGPAPSTRQDPALAPAPTPRRAPRFPAVAPTRGAAATGTMRSVALLLLPSLLALLAHGKGPRRPAAGRGRGRGPGGGKRGPYRRPAPCIWLPSASTALRRLRWPPRRPSRAGRGLQPAGSCRGSRHSRPAKTSPLIISPDLMGFLCCNSSRHPLPAHTHALTRALPRHTPGV